jgi:hypothetical protein
MNVGWGLLWCWPAAPPSTAGGFLSSSFFLRVSVRSGALRLHAGLGLHRPCCKAEAEWVASRMGGQPKKVGVFSCFWHLREVWFDVALPLDAGRRALLRRWCPGSVQRHKVVFFCVFCEVLRCPLNVGWRLHRPCCGAGAGGVITGAGESSSRERSWGRGKQSFTLRKGGKNTKPCCGLCVLREILGSSHNRSCALDIQALGLPREDLHDLDQPLSKAEFGTLLRSCRWTRPQSRGSEGSPSKSGSRQFEVLHLPLRWRCGRRFLLPVEQDLRVVKGILSLFEQATGLAVNCANNQVYPINWSSEQIALVRSTLSCLIADFPCTYLGVPLSIKRLPKAMMQPLVDKVSRWLPPWAGLN